MFKLKTMTKWALSAGLAASLVLVPLAGCASSDGAAPEPAPAQEEADATEQEDTAATPEEASVWVASSYKLSQTDSDGKVTEYSSTYELDEAGNLVKETDSEGSEVTYTLDEDGWATKIESGELTWTYELEKDDQGRLTVEKGEQSSIAYTYNDQGFVTETTATSAIFSVDEEGNRIEGSDDMATTKTTYDENGFPLLRAHVFSDGRLETSYAYEYGDDGLPTSVTIDNRNFDADGNEYEDTATTATASFEYDEHGNLVKEVLEDEYGTSTYEYGYVEVANPSIAARIQSHTRGV